jgi:hypothetical protein
MFLIMSISLPHLATAQAVPYAGTFAKSKEEVDKALKEMQAYAGQKLPIVDGFVATGDQTLSRFERAFYQFSIDLLPGGVRWHHRSRHGKNHGMVCRPGSLEVGLSDPTLEWTARARPIGQA